MSRRRNNPLDVCDMCMSSGVHVDRVTDCGERIGVECGCEDKFPDGRCGDIHCEDCYGPYGRPDPDAKLSPGVYSVFVLRDDGTWVQPVYRLRRPIPAQEFYSWVAEDEGGFIAFEADLDDEADPDAIRDFDKEVASAAEDSSGEDC